MGCVEGGEKWMEREARGGEAGQRVMTGWGRCREGKGRREVCRCDMRVGMSNKSEGAVRHIKLRNDS